MNIGVNKGLSEKKRREHRSEKALYFNDFRVHGVEAKMSDTLIRLAGLFECESADNDVLRWDVYVEEPDDAL